VSRQIVYIGAIPQDTDVLLTNRNAMISDGWVAQGILGTSTLFSGLACTPTSPAGMTVNVAPGCVYSQQNIDNSAYGSLSSDTTDQIIKIGISQETINFSCPAPATSGQSVVYLIEAAFVEEDTGATVLPYYNAANPATPWAGPNNTGTSQNTVRQDICSVQVKVGVPATTGSQTTPAPDAGYTALWTVTVANGQTTITSGNISQVSGAPFISETLTQKISQTTADARYAQIASVQKGSYSFANDTSGAANTITATLSPAPTAYTKGMMIVINVANTNTSATNINLNALGNIGVTYKGNTLTGGELVAGRNAIFTYDGTNFELNSTSGIAAGPTRTLLTANTTFYVSTSGSDSNNGLTSGTPWQTIQHAWTTIQKTYDLDGYTVTIQLEDGTYATSNTLSGWMVGQFSPSQIVINGDSVTPSNVLISPSSGDAFQLEYGGCTFQNMKVQSSAGNCFNATQQGNLVTGVGIVLGTCSGSHFLASATGAMLNINNNYTIAGSAATHWVAQAAGASIVVASGLTITLTGTPAFSLAFAEATLLGLIFLQSTPPTFSGSATGPRYLASINGVIATQGSGSTYLPGSTSGSTATGGQYA
jgi:hypothetical protein